jgi:hypothetical protein
MSRGSRAILREVFDVQWLLAPVAILSGMLMVVQSACNGMLEKIIERPVTVGVISLGVGITTLLVGGALFGQLGFPTDARAMPGPGGHGSAELAVPWRCCRNPSLSLDWGLPYTSACSLLLHL